MKKVLAILVMSRQLWLYRGILLSLMAFVSTPIQSSSQGEASSAHLSRSDFETGFDYVPEPIIAATLACWAYRWSVVINWGDGGLPETETGPQLVPDSAIRTPPGLHFLSSTHRYLNSGSYDADIKLFADCSGRASVKVYQGLQQVHVFDHVPLKSFLATRSVKRGSSIELSVSLVAQAPPSGTRVFLHVDKPEVFSSDVLPRHLDVPAKSDHMSIRLPTLRTAPLGTVTLVVNAINGRHSAMTVIEQ